MKTFLQSAPVIIAAICFAVISKAQSANSQNFSWNTKITTSATYGDNSSAIAYKKFDSRGVLLESGMVKSAGTNSFLIDEDQLLNNYSVQKSTEHGRDKSGNTEVTVENFYKNDSLCAVTKTYYGANNRLLSRFSKDVRSNKRQNEVYLYDRKGRLSKVMCYEDGKLIEFFTMDYGTEASS